MTSFKEHHCLNSLKHIFILLTTSFIHSSLCTQLQLGYSTTIARALWEKLSHLPNVPVDVPLLHVVVAPRLHHITHTQVDPDQAVGSNSQNLVFPAAFKPVGQAKASSVKLLYHGLSY